MLDFSGFDGQVTDVQVWDYPLRYSDIFNYMSGGVYGYVYVMSLNPCCVRDHRSSHIHPHTYWPMGNLVGHVVMWLQAKKDFIIKI